MALQSRHGSEARRPITKRSPAISLWQVKEEMALQSRHDPRPGGRSLNVSPARKGWGPIKKNYLSAVGAALMASSLPNLREKKFVR